MHYCLACVEMLWEAKFTNRPHSPTIHACTGQEVDEAATAKTSTPRRDSFLNVTTHGTNILPTAEPEQFAGSGLSQYAQCEIIPTRFQHLAPLVKAGTSLSSAETAMVSLWKWTSSKQITVSPSLNQPDELGSWENLTGLSRLQCEGRDLSSVLSELERDVEW